MSHGRVLLKVSSGSAPGLATASLPGSSWLGDAVGPSGVLSPGRLCPHELTPSSHMGSEAAVFPASPKICKGWGVV